MSGPGQQPKRVHWQADVQDNHPRPREERPWDYCFFCETEEHTLLTCDLNPERKLAFLRNKKLCTICLGRRHRQPGCPDTEVEVCKVCGERHFDFIHHSQREIAAAQARLRAQLSTTRRTTQQSSAVRPSTTGPPSVMQRSINEPGPSSSRTNAPASTSATPVGGTQPSSNVYLMQHVDLNKPDSTGSAQKPK